MKLENCVCVLQSATWPRDAVKKLETGVSLPTVCGNIANCDERKDELSDWEWVRSDEPVSRELLLPPTYQGVASYRYGLICDKSVTNAWLFLTKWYDFWVNPGNLGVW